MQVSTAHLERLLDATRTLVRLQPVASLSQAIADSALAIFEASGSAFFRVDDECAVLEAASGSYGTLPFGARHTIEGLLSAAGPRTPASRVSPVAEPAWVEAQRPALSIPLRSDTNVQGVLWIQRDPPAVTESEPTLQVHMFATLAAVALENACDYQRVLEIDSKRQDDIAILAHELRNPLGAIVSALHILERLGAPDPRVLELRSLIGRQTTHLTRLVEDVLDLARLRHGKLRLERERLDLRDIVRVVVATVKASGRAAGHDVREDVAGSPLLVDGDATRIEQVVRNLIDNAVKYSPQGTAIHVTAEKEATTAVLRVRDEGIGIAADMLSRLFDPFAQAEAAGKRAAGGLGLGLPLVQAIVEQHGGTIAAHSSGAGKGSEFVVRLPLHSSS